MSNFFEGEMPPRDRQANASAKFYPAVEARDNLGSYAPPCMEIGGVQVFVYVRDGILVISGHYDTADTSAFAAYGPGSASIPTVVKMGDGDPVWEALPDDAVTEQDAKSIRQAHATEPGTWPAFVLPAWLDE